MALKLFTWRFGNSCQDFDISLDIFRSLKILTWRHCKTGTRKLWWVEKKSWQVKDYRWKVGNYAWEVGLWDEDVRETMEQVFTAGLLFLNFVEVLSTSTTLLVTVKARAWENYGVADPPWGIQGIWIVVCWHFSPFSHARPPWSSAWW